WNARARDDSPVRAPARAGRRLGDAPRDARGGVGARRVERAGGRVPGDARLRPGDLVRGERRVRAPVGAAARRRRGGVPAAGIGWINVREITVDRSEIRAD